MPDRKELLEAALAIYTTSRHFGSEDEYTITADRAVQEAKSLLSAVDAECEEDGPLNYSIERIAPEAAVRLCPDVKVLVEAAERVLNDMPELVTLRRVLAPFRRERSA